MEGSLSWKEWKPGDFHLINRVRWNQEEADNLVGVLKNDWFASGEFVKKSSQRFSDFIGSQNVNLTNSGSASIDVALKSLREKGFWKPGDMVLHPINTFVTSISSAIDLGLRPVYVDTQPATYVADPSQVERALKMYPRIKGMILPHLFGSIADLNSIRGLLDDRFLIEDCCDTLGGTYEGRHIGNFGEFGAFSFYASHHVTSGGVGGALSAATKNLHDTARSIIYWGRDFKEGDEEFLKRYSYATRGTDSQMSELQAAFLFAQLSKLPSFVRDREKQFEEMTSLFGNTGYFEMPRTNPGAKPSWFAYPLTVKADAPFTRAEFARYLTKNRVEVRPLMCGNVLEQAPFRHSEHIVIGDSFTQGDKTERSGLFVPCWGMAEEQKKDYYSILGKFFERQSSSR